MNNSFNINGTMKKVAFVDGNRAINPNNVAKHVESLKEFGRNLVPLLYVDAIEIKDRNLCDAVSNAQVSKDDYPNYIVVLDGQHRFMAACELANSDAAEGFTIDALKWEKVELGDKSFEDILIEVNTRTQPWKGSDYINGCILHDPNNEVLRFAKELTDLGISAKTSWASLSGQDSYFEKGTNWTKSLAALTPPLLIKGFSSASKTFIESKLAFPIPIIITDNGKNELFTNSFIVLSISSIIPSVKIINI